MGVLQGRVSPPWQKAGKRRPDAQAFQSKIAILVLLFEKCGIGKRLMSQFNVQQIGDNTVVEFTSPSLMDPIELEQIAQQLYKLIDEQDKRRIILDFEKVQYLSSQAIGILLAMQKKLSALKKSNLILCGVGARLMELLRITRLDKVLTISHQKEAIKSSSGH
jgi:anti-sigma B factor antagonist